MLGTNCDMMCDVIDGLIGKTIVGLDGISGVENFFCRRLCVCGIRVCVIYGEMELVCVTR